ncbi:MAG TPA: lysylphosphatidylglycerol synthase transmembrane domain-containing protein, partial [Vicinamibacterales bacterium]|nr:lysylphosphatidylglycerol synthase transmembrane domain-containing protein [Vicinamibacterales bacterium]
LVQAVLSMGLLAFLLRSLDLAAFRTLFARLPLWFYLLSLLVVLGGQVVYAWRWRLLLAEAGVRVPFLLTVRQYFIGTFLNNFLPSTVGGDVGKVYFLGRDHGYRVVMASVVLDRMLGLAMLAMWATVALWLFQMPSPVLAAARLAVTGIAALLAAILIVTGTGTGGLAARVAWLGPRGVALAEHLQQFRIDMAVSLRSPLLMLQAALAVIVYALAAGAVYVVFIRIQTGTAPPLMMTTGVVMATAVLSNIPVSLNGLGLREQLHALLLAPLGVPREVAVAVSLLFFGHLLVSSLFGAGFWIQSRPLPGRPTAPLGT